MPTYCVNLMADHTAALMLALNRRLLNHNTAVKSKSYLESNGGKGQYQAHEYTNSRFGIRKYCLARRVATRMQACDCKDIAFDPYVKQEFADQFNAVGNMDEIYERSRYDFLTYVHEQSRKND